MKNFQTACHNFLVLFSNSFSLPSSILLSLLIALSVSAYSLSSNAAELAAQKNYTYMYYNNGYPTRLAGTRSPQVDANTTARKNPDVVFQTGYFSMMFDTDDLQIKGWDTFIGSDYMTALTAGVETFTPATLSLFVTVDNTRYQAVSSAVQSSNGEPAVRVIESGQFRKRIDHINVRLQHPSNGSLLAEAATLEITVWADRVIFHLDASTISNAVATEIVFVEPVTDTANNVNKKKSRRHKQKHKGNKVTLAVSPVASPLITKANALSYITEAKWKKNGVKLNTHFDQDANAIVIAIPSMPARYPADQGRLDEYVIRLTNPGKSAINLPLVFDEQTRPAGITGTTMLMVSDVNGSPLGHNIQISKNWHNAIKDKFVGPWLRGSTLVTLAAGESKTFRLRVVQGYWAKVPAAHTAQLSLIGWPSGGFNRGAWTWNQSALGAWGESITFDPSLHLANSFIADYRPALTTPIRNSKAHGWTENVGGAGFLVYRDAGDKFRHLKKIKTAYKRNGPNLSEVHYSGITDDNKIRVTYITRLGSTFDYSRHFHSFRYEFLDDVKQPKRLAFYQLAADYYKTAHFNDFYYGDHTGLQGRGENGIALKADNSIQKDKLVNKRKIDRAANGGKGYNGRLPFTDGWLTIADTHGNSGKTLAKANRGLILRSASLNGEKVDVYLHQYRSGWGSDPLGTNQTIFDLGLSHINHSYTAGDIIEGEVELLLTPKHVDNYWGADNEFLARLATYAQPWQAVYDETRYNAYTVSAQAGTVLEHYPVEILAANANVVADFTFDQGGVGHIPVIIKNVPVGYSLMLQRFHNNQWLGLGGVNLERSQNYYQGTLNGALNSGRAMDYAFSVKRPNNNLAASWRVRVLREPLKALEKL